MLVLYQTSKTVVSKMKDFRGPWAFDLYPKLFKLSKESPQPYSYEAHRINMVVPLEKTDTQIPIQISDVQKEHILCLRYAAVRGISLASIRRKAEQVLGLDLDLKSFYDAIFYDPVLSTIIKELVGLRPIISATPFEGLVRSVVKQVIRAETARMLMAKITKTIGRRIDAEGFSAYSFPTAAEMASVSISELKALGLGYKAELLKTLSEDTANGELDLLSMKNAEDDEIVARLVSYKGVGSWTARAFAADGLGRLDLYPMEDINLRKAVALLFNGGRYITWNEVKKTVDRYDEHRGLLIFYLMAYLWLQR